MNHRLNSLIAFTAMLTVLPAQAQAIQNDFYEFTVVTHDSLSDSANFGRAVEVDSGIVAVGMLSQTFPVPTSGRVFLYEAESGDFIRHISVQDEFNDSFGFSLSADNGLLAVGSRLAMNRDGVQAGGVFLYDIRSGELIREFFAGDGEQYDFFGHDVALKGDTLVVGASGVDFGTEYQAGAAYVFDVSTGEELAKLVASDGEGFDLFGQYLAFDEGLITVGAIGVSVPGPGFGAVYLYDAESFEQQAKITNVSARSFGVSMAVHHGTLAIGAHAAGSDGGGAVYLFDAKTYDPIGELSPESHRVDEYFGWRMDAHDGWLAVSAPGNDYDGIGIGSAYIFDLDSQAQIARLLHASPAFGDGFGNDIALDQDSVVIGSIEDSIKDRNGSAYLYNISCRGDLNRDLQITIDDINAFVQLFIIQDLSADLDQNGVLNYFDLSIIINAYRLGCGV